MRLFHPVFNQDGTVSLFRVSCLLVALLSFIALAILKFQESEGGALSANEESVTESKASSFSLFKEQEDPKEVILENRKLALTELEEASEFFRTCGLLNQGFEGCAYTFSDKVLGSFIPKVEAFDDGFSLSLFAKGAQLNDLCPTLEVTSQSGLLAFDSQGKLTESCLLKKQNVQISSLRRSTDELHGNPAPSGRKKILTQVADHTKVSQDRI